VPAHNAAAFIHRTLEALLASQLPRDDFEIIVVDDASTDETSKIAARFADHVIRTGDSPRGPAFARNRGAEAARAPYIAFVDADVVVSTQAISRMVSRLDESAERVAVFGAYDDEPDDTSPVSTYRNLLHRYAHLQTAGNVATFWAGCGAVRADAFRAVKGFDQSRFPRPQIEDIELGYRLTRHGTILLDPAIQGKHLKNWSVLSMMRTDFLDRGVPWVRLLLGTRQSGGASNPSLGIRALGSTVLAPIALMLAVSLAFVPNIYTAGAALVCFALVAWLNAPFYALLKRKTGWRVAVTAIPLHFGYHLISAGSVPVGLVQYLSYDGGAGFDPALTGRRFLPLASGEIISRCIAFVATAYLARTLGPTPFGRIAFAVALVNQIGLALSIGVGEVGSREVARDPEHASAHVAAGAALRLILAVLALAGIIAVTFVLPLDAQQRTITWLFALTIIPLALDTGWVYKGLGTTSRVGQALVVDQLTCLILVVVAVRYPFHETRVPVIQLVGDAAATVFLAIPLLRWKLSLPSVAAIKALASQASFTTASRILRMVVISFDTVLLGLMVSSREVGWYSAAYRIVFFVMAILISSHIAFLPEITRSAADNGQLRAIMSRSVGLALAVTAPFVVGGILLAPAIMRLIFGADYEGGAVAFQILLASLVLFAIHGASRSVFIAMKRVRLEAGIILAGVVLNVALNFILIPRMGIKGSALAALGGELLTMAGVLLALALLGVRPALRESLPAIAAAGVLAGAIRIVSPFLPLAATIALGGIVYVTAAGAFTVLLRRRISFQLASRNPEQSRT
jgi:O-antigen/teichoic acid export membrane protein